MLRAMKTALAEPGRPPTGNIRRSRPVFNILVFYEDAASGLHARQVYDSLVRDAGDEWNFRPIFSQFDEVVGSRACEARTIQKALQADMIILSSHLHSDLSGQVRIWLEMWVELKGDDPAAILTLFDRPDEVRITTGLIRDYLQCMARKGRVWLFTEPTASPPERLNLGLVRE